MPSETLCPSHCTAQTLSSQTTTPSPRAVPTLQTSVGGVYAIGDVASFPLLCAGGVAVRQEHVTHARSSAAQAAAAITGEGGGLVVVVVVVLVLGSYVSCMRVCSLPLAPPPPRSPLPPPASIRTILRLRLCGTAAREIQGATRLSVLCPSEGNMPPPALLACCTAALFSTCAVLCRVLCRAVVSAV